MELTVVPVVKPDAANFIFGQSHFIKTVEDLHEALVGAVPGIRFGLAFCEASGKRLVRWSGNDEAAALGRRRSISPLHANGSDGSRGDGRDPGLGRITFWGSHLRIDGRLPARGLRTSLMGRRPCRSPSRALQSLPLRKRPSPTPL